MKFFWLKRLLLPSSTLPIFHLLLFISFLIQLSMDLQSPFILSQKYPSLYQPILYQALITLLSFLSCSLPLLFVFLLHWVLFHKALILSHKLVLYLLYLQKAASFSTQLAVYQTHLYWLLTIQLREKVWMAVRWRPTKHLTPLYIVWTEPIFL